MTREQKLSNDLDLRFDPTAPDLRQQRPYYLVPLLDLDKGRKRRDVLQKTISAEITQRHSEAEEAIKTNANRQSDDDGSITDIYVFSHGWHRNLFSGIAAYDRLFSRFLVLLRRGRIEPELPFHPLFIAFHWHSDPGQDAWLDKAGRREKASFMQNVQAVFEPGQCLANFLNDFEEIYELFSKVSAPDTKLLDPEADIKAKALTTRLETYQLRGVLADPRVDRNATLPGEKAMLVWRCYQEARAKRLLIDQADHPKRFNNPLLALSTFLRFAVSAVGLAALLGILTSNSTSLWHTLQSWMSHGWPQTKIEVENQGQLYWPLNLVIRAATTLEKAGAALFISARDWLVEGHHLMTPLIADFVLGCIVIPTILLAVSIFWFRALRKFRSSGIPLLATAAWVPLQFVLTLPILAVAVSTFIFRTWLILGVPVLFALGHKYWGRDLFWACITIAFATQVWRFPTLGLFSERRDRHPLTRIFRGGVWVRDILSFLAMLPLRGLRLAIAPDSRVNGVADALENQLAFFEMQRNGVQAGIEASDFMEQLLRSHPSLGEARLHIVGHSFGGLLAVNLARHLTRPVQTICLVQAAIASAWFEGEDKLYSQVQGAIACIYSGYDTANGFYYPLANGGRLAAGYVGLCNLPPHNQVQPVSLGKDGLFASLSEPPRLNEVITKTLCNAFPQLQWQKAVNLDASRLIYEGDPKSGGGHDDIFKDDVVHLIWAVTEISIGAHPTVPTQLLGRV